MSIGLKSLILPALIFAAQAQVADQIRTATITGTGGSSGKCTIEVRVDMSAEVDIYGNSGRLRTIAGQPAVWTRLECTAPLPYNMTDFRFRGIDGRGNVRLLQDPRNNNSMAVIRVEDPRGGAENFTFEIEWSGGSGGSPTGGFASGWGTPSSAQTSAAGQATAQESRRGGLYGARGGARVLTSEQAIDLCRTELRTRAERDYGLRSIDVTSAGADTAQNRRDWVTGAFTETSGGFRRRANYRFNCEVDYRAGAVRTFEILRADGSVLPTASSAVTSAVGTSSSVSAYDQMRLFRSCQDAVISRANRDGYGNVVVTSTAMDTSRGQWVTGAVLASRGTTAETFDFGCSMDFNAARVLDIQFTRR